MGSAAGAGAGFGSSFGGTGSACGAAGTSGDWIAGFTKTGACTGAEAAAGRLESTTDGTESGDFAAGCGEDVSAGTILAGPKPGLDPAR